MKFLFAFVLLASTAFAEPIYGVNVPAREQVELPADEAKWYLTVFDSGTTYERWFETQPDLNRLARQTHFHVITPDSAAYRTRYAKTTPVPCIRLQKPDGETAFEVCGQSIPMTPDALANGLHKGILKHCPNGQCEPPPKEDTSPLDHTGPPTAPPAPEFPAAGLIAILAVAGLGIGAVAAVAKSMKGQR